jgi:beta-phosphoglucomutase
MLRAIIFDFNGIILNDEPLHFSSMRDAVAQIGLSVSQEQYWANYLPLDDERCLTAICADRGIHISTADRERILRLKTERYRQLLEDNYPLFPGAAPFIRSAARRYPLALASGARREEIERTLEATGLRSEFLVIIAAEDFTVGKPHPESFLAALKHLNALVGSQYPPICPGECLVIEDAVAGVQGARAAGMHCLAVCNSYSAEALQAASQVVSSLEEVTIEDLERMTEESP